MINFSDTRTDMMNVDVKENNQDHLIDYIDIVIEVKIVIIAEIVTRDDLKKEVQQLSIRVDLVEN